MTAVLEVIEERERGGAVRLRLAGELDRATGETLRAVVRGSRMARCDRYELDLEHVTFVDRAGARALSEAVHAIEDVGGCVVVVPGAAVANVLRRMGMDRELVLV